MLSRFDPVPVSRCNFEHVQYMANVTAAAEDETSGDYGWPKGLLNRFVLEVCNEKYPVGVGSGKGNGTEKWPLALFSGGLNTTRLFYSHLAQEIASHGFTVIMIDHPYDTDIVEFPNGDVIFGGSVASPANGSEPAGSARSRCLLRARPRRRMRRFGRTSTDVWTQLRRSSVRNSPSKRQKIPRRHQSRRHNARTRT